MNTRSHFIFVVAFLFSVTAAYAASLSIADDEVIKKILSESCVQCHGPDSEQSGSIGYITDLNKLIDNQLVIPGNPQESKLFLMILDADDPMPPFDAPETVKRPSVEDVQILRNWITSLKVMPTMTKGGPVKSSPPNSENVETSTFVEKAFVYATIEKFLRSQPPESHVHFRFLTIDNVHNSNVFRPENKRDLANYRMAISKTINSLSWAADIYLPPLLDEQGLVMAIDFRKLRNAKGKIWSHEAEWLALERNYPYGVEPTNNSHFDFIRKSTFASIPIVRGDWFVANSTQPKIYHEILGIPETARQLEDDLNVEVESNILLGIAHRVGFTKSGVSKNANRLVERHPARYGYYWKSYDFRQGAVQGNIFQYPTGPEFAANPFNERAFKHDGGEIIFSLPNGLQGFMLATGDGARLDSGPPDLVSDDKRVVGNPLILNGISCLTCHTEGLKSLPDDEMLRASPVQGGARKFIERLHPPGDAEGFLLSDNDRFFMAAKAAMRPFARQEIRATSDLPEPITPVARGYFATDLVLAELAAEIGFANVQELGNRINLIPDIRRLGLGNVTQGGVVKREDWEKTVEGHSKFQELSRLLDLGFPITVSSPTTK